MVEFFNGQIRRNARTLLVFLIQRDTEFSPLDELVVFAKFHIGASLVVAKLEIYFWEVKLKIYQPL